MGAFRDITGQKFGRYTARRYVGMNKRGRAIWEVECECGTVSTALSNSLLTGHTTSCSCLRYERTRAANTKHGFAKRGCKTPEYIIRRGMIDRCENPNNRRWAEYGGRGITICDRWRTDFAAFLLDVGARPSSKHSIDRIDVDGNYEPGNVRWATAKEQARNKTNNRMVQVGAECVSMAEACERSGIKYGTAMMRLRRGWSNEDAALTPVGQRVA